MGSNPLPIIPETTLTYTVEMANDERRALIGDIVPRGADGIPADGAASLGRANMAYLETHSDEYYTGGRGFNEYVLFVRAGGDPDG